MSLRQLISRHSHYYPFSYKLAVLVENCTPEAVSGIESRHLFVLAGASRGLCLAVLLTEVVVLAAQALSLLPQRLDIAVLLLNLGTEAGDLAGLAGRGQLLRLLSLAVGALVLLKLLLETQDFQDHDVGAVQDEREEEGEAAEVHVTLAVELAGLDLEAFVTHNRAVVGVSVSMV